MTDKIITVLDNWTVKTFAPASVERHGNENNGSSFGKRSRV